MDSLRKCPRCGKILPADMFAPNTKHCRLCRRDYDWQYRYGLSPDEYFELWTKQNGKCKICGKELDIGQYLCVDHQSDTGDVRGLLCKECNRGLGCFYDDVTILKNAIKYLERIKTEND